MFTLSWGDWGKGIIVAILAPAFVAITSVLGAIINAPGFDAWAVDYGALFHNLTNTLIVSSYGAGVGYILKNLLTTDEGKFLGLGK